MKKKKSSSLDLRAVSSPVHIAFAPWFMVHDHAKLCRSAVAGKTQSRCVKGSHFVGISQNMIDFQSFFGENLCIRSYVQHEASIFEVALHEIDADTNSCLLRISKKMTAGAGAWRLCIGLIFVVYHKNVDIRSCKMRLRASEGMCSTKLQFYLRFTKSMVTRIPVCPAFSEKATAGAM